MAQGHTNAGIARRLFLSERTVETHIASLLVKLGVEPAAHGHHRVLTVLAFLKAEAQRHGRRLPDAATDWKRLVP